MQASWCFCLTSPLPEYMISEVGGGDSWISMGFFEPLFPSRLYSMVLYQGDSEEAKVCLSEVQDSEFAVRVLSALRIMDSTILLSLQPRLPLSFTLPINPSWLLRISSSMTPHGLLYHLKGSCHPYIPEMCCITCVLLCSSFSRYWCGWNSTWSQGLWAWGCYRGPCILSVPHWAAYRTPPL